MALLCSAQTLKKHRQMNQTGTPQKKEKIQGDIARRLFILMHNFELLFSRLLLK